jgi:hypothetical protein
LPPTTAFRAHPSVVSLRGKADSWIVFSRPRTGTRRCRGRP